MGQYRLLIYVMYTLKAKGICIIDISSCDIFIKFARITLMGKRWTRQCTRKSISWLLIAVMFQLFFLPSHLHLHHLDNTLSTAHAHTIDVHVVADLLDQNHHDDATLINTDVNILVKQVTDNILVPFILIAIIFVLAVTRRVTWHRWLNTSDRFTYCYCTPPPPRAPPVS